ncbi:MAG: hypothetical protein JWQ35_1954 [Bacteriovoracaceae bacterium]|nr:hypothetical protein [Bacteriovoracaceae bacterium]
MFTFVENTTVYRRIGAIFFAIFYSFALRAEAINEDVIHEINEADLQLSPNEENQLDQFLLGMNDQIGNVQIKPKKTRTPKGVSSLADDVSNPVSSYPGNFQGDVDFPLDPGGSQPSYDPGGYGYDFPFPSSTRSGSSEKVALEVLFQTFNFYGVAHIVEKKNTQIDFKIVKSKYGYFMDVTKLDVAYAIREFARYLNAHLCGQATMENFYRAFAQVPAEEIGLRFKYDMAWAILGNSLPKEPNQVMRLGTKWKALDQVLSSLTFIRSSENDSPEKRGQLKELRNWSSILRDVSTVMTGLNRQLCYVDIRPNPKDELIKRVVIGKMLEMTRHLNDSYSEMKELLDQVNKQGKADQISSLRKSAP